MNDQYNGENGSSPEEKKQEEVVRFQMIEGKPYVTYFLIVFTACVYIAQRLTKAQMGYDLPMAYGAKMSGYITYMHQYWRLITPIFLHGSFTHILFNMYALLTLGPSLEKYWGHFDFLRLYLICGFCGNVVSHLCAPQVISVGASTSLFGLITAQAMFIYENRQILRNYKKALQNIAFVILLNLLIGLSGGIDNWGHLGGLIGGTLLGYMCGPRIALVYNQQDQKPVLVDTMPRKTREISFVLVTVFFIALTLAFQGR